MLEVGRTWIVLLRNVSHAVRVAEENQLMAALVLHAETGLVLGVSISGTAAEALAGAFASALANPVADLPPAPPARVVSLVEVVPEVRKAIAAALFGSPEVIEAGSIPEAEDIFDSLVGHIAGRAQPTEPPSTEDWSLLVGQALAFLRAEPWARWSDVVPLGLEVTVDGTEANYVAIVMGKAGVQRGLALYPGMTMPPGLHSPGPRPGPGPALEATPNGTLLLMLDRPGETPTAFADKALRYGWPAGEAYLPTLVSVGPDGPCDLAGVDAQRLQVALAAVAALDSRGLALAGGAGAMTGRVALADGAQGEFEIIQRPLVVIDRRRLQPSSPWAGAILVAGMKPLSNEYAKGSQPDYYLHGERGTHLPTACGSCASADDSHEGSCRGLRLASAGGACIGTSRAPASSGSRLLLRCTR